jgi:hypothetical protein
MARPVCTCDPCRAVRRRRRLRARLWTLRRKRGLTRLGILKAAELYQPWEEDGSPAHLFRLVAGITYADMHDAASIAADPDLISVRKRRVLRMWPRPCEQATVEPDP